MKKKSKKISNFFLACEFKPAKNSDLWGILDPFAYDIKAAFIYGSLGVINYEPESYAIIDLNDKGQPLMGYVVTITHDETVALLDKIKGHYGETAFNFHDKKKVKAYTDIDKRINAWCYVLSDKVLNSYRQIEQIEFGITNQEDTQLIELLEKIEEST